MIFSHIISDFRFADFLDIFLTSIFLYSVLTWLQRRASRSVIITLGSVITLYLSARMLNMYMVSQLFQAGLTAALVGLVIIFQNDIRMFAEQLTTWNILRSRHLTIASNKTVESLIEALCSLAKDKIGALVVIRGKESLDRHLSGGISLNGRLSIPLILSIFHPSTPGHDGAVIIEGDRIEKFGVRLPLSHNLLEIGSRGTRHSAALGLAERSDALLLVVSEERGSICIGEGNHLSVVSREQLTSQLLIFYKKLYPAQLKGHRREWFTNNAWLKIVSLTSAILVWFFFAYRVDTVNRTFTIPLEYRNVPVGWVIKDPRPTEILISISGPERTFNFNPDALVASIDMSTISEGKHTLPISEINLNLPSGIQVGQIIPSNFTFNAIRMIEIELPIKIKTSGSLPANLTLEELRVHPKTVGVLMPEQYKKAITELASETIDLRAITQNTLLKQNIIVPNNVQLLDDKQQFVQVSVSVNQKPEPPPKKNK